MEKRLDSERYFHRIPGLIVPRSVPAGEISEAINAFIDAVPNLAMELEDDVQTMKEAGFANDFERNMGKLSQFLRRIYARGLEAEAERLIRCAKDDTQKIFSIRNFKPFITDVLSLSVALQKEQKFEDGAKVKRPGKIELYTSVSKTVAAIGNMLDDDFIDDAKALLADLVKHHPETPVFANLLALINGENLVEAMGMIGALKNRFNDTLAQMAGTDLSKKILAVDDMPETLSFVNNALKSNYKVVAVPSGKAALKVLEQQTPNLFILDIDMPEMDGFELALRIKQLPEHSKTPIIFLTGNSSREHINNAMMVGCDEFIVKPATHEYLLTKVGAFLSLQ